MKVILSVILLISFSAFAQNNEDSKLTSSLDSGWKLMAKNWKFQIGDNTDWAKADYNDSLWQPVKLLDQSFFNSIPKDGRIIWFRRQISTDSTLTKQLVLRIYQSGASDVYLNGKLIHKLGIISSNPDSATYYNPGIMSLSFPLPYNTSQTLAIRFLNLPDSYPIYSPFSKSFLYIYASTFDQAVNDYAVRYDRKFNNRINIGIGVAFILCVLYLSFFLFFPAQRINLYFSLCNFFFALYLIFASGNMNYQKTSFKLNISVIIFLITYLLLLIYCTYKVFNQKIGWLYWSILAIGILAVPAVFLISDGLISTIVGVLGIIEIIRITIKSLQKNKTGARIILSGMAIDLIFWIFYLLSMLSVINIPNIDSYIPFALLIAPLSLAIYLGHTFGMTSQSLRQKLRQVEQLSNEKQQILSTQNETLEQQVKERTSALNQSLENLKSTQTQLIQSEKMASLGELTAGIAHEIQNPLNFVNNFSEVNKELLTEMKDEIDKGNIEEVKAIANDVIDNEEKINYHGKRADAIVKGMLQHSRSSSGVKESTDINELVDEYLRLSYHGLRAKDKSLNATLKTDFDGEIETVNIIPQDIGRVILNLLTNAFYAVNEKKHTPVNIVGQSYEPTVSVTTKKIGDKIEINVADNGNGISHQAMDKIFQPFFTTKPTGQGTGLGLSLSYDIVTKGHGGELKVETKEGEGTTFTISLPISV